MVPKNVSWNAEFARLPFKYISPESWNNYSSCCDLHNLYTAANLQEIHSFFFNKIHYYFALTYYIFVLFSLCACVAGIYCKQKDAIEMRRLRDNYSFLRAERLSKQRKDNNSGG